MDTHISFPFLTKYSGPHNYWVLHHNLARFGRWGVEGVGRPEYIPFPLGLWREGRGAWRKTQLQIMRKGLRTSVSPLAGFYQLPPSCISHIATFSAKQKSPRCKWHRSIIWRRGWLKDESVYHFIKSQLETQWWLPQHLCLLLLSIVWGPFI